MKITERVKMGGRGQGSLFKQDGSANWFSRYYAHGVEHIESTGTPNVKAAKRIHKGKLDELAADRQGLKPYLTPESKRVTVGELLDDLEADYRLRGVKSLPQCVSHGKHVREVFGRWRAVEITPDKIDAYCERRLAAGATSATVNRETQILAHAFRLAVDRGKVATMPKVRRLAERNVRKGFFEADEFTTVVNALPEYLQDVARFAYLTGWRRSEILGLTWADVDLTGGVIRLAETKNGHGRALVMAGDLRAILTGREQARLVTTHTGDVRVVDLVFHHGGKPIVDYRKAWATACRAAGFGSHVVNAKTGRTEQDRRLHDFRRTAARNMVRQGTPERVAMEVTGHRTRSMFDRYSIVSEGDLRAAMARATLPVAVEATPMADDLTPSPPGCSAAPHGGHRQRSWIA